MENKTQNTNAEEEPTYNLMTFKEKERHHKINFNGNKEEDKDRVKRLKARLKKEVEEMREEIKVYTERTKRKYNPLTKEQYKEFLKQDRERAKEWGWKVIETTDKKNIYTLENIRKRKKQEKKELEIFIKRGYK